MVDTLVGRTLDRYQIVEQIGVGGMATVFKAYQRSLDRVVAIKVLPQHFLHDETFVARFQREARSVAGLNHPNILPVYDFGRQDDIVYVVMQYIPQGTLKERILEPLDLRFCARIIAGVADALDYAHRRSIIHRDVKPSNILLGEDDWPFLGDFGIAKLADANTRLTKTGSGIGTPEYMSPEQAQGLPIDGRSDIYSLGAVLYEMVTGSVPFSGETPLSVVFKHVYEPARPVRELNPEIPESVEAVIAKALAKNPGDRYATGADFAQSLWTVVSTLDLPPELNRPTPRSLPSIPLRSGEVTLGNDARLEGMLVQARTHLSNGEDAQAIAQLKALHDIRRPYRDSEELLAEASARQDKKRAIETFVANGARALGTGNAVLAVDMLRRALTLDPNNAEAKAGLATAEAALKSSQSTAVASPANGVGAAPTITPVNGGAATPATGNPAGGIRPPGPNAGPPPASSGGNRVRTPIIAGILGGALLLCGGVALAYGFQSNGFGMALFATPTATATLEPTSTPTETSTSTPEPPTATATPEPTATEAPPTETPVPPPTDTPRPIPTSTPRPANTNTPVPPPTNTPVPPPTNTPRPIPTNTQPPPPPPQGGGDDGGGSSR